MNKLLETLKAIDVTDTAKINNVLQSIRCDLLSFNRCSDMRQVGAVKGLLLHFLSINEKQTYESPRYFGQRHFQQGIEHLIKEADRIVFDFELAEKKKKILAQEIKIKEVAEMKSAKAKVLEAKKKWIVSLNGK